MHSNRNSRRKLGSFFVTCKDTQEETQDDIYKLEVPTEITTLNYGNRTIKANIDDFDDHHVIDGGHYGCVTSMSLKSQRDVVFAVKKIGLETSRDREQATYTDLTTIKRVGTLQFPYIVAYYGSIIKRASSELWICLELMDTSVAKFYQAMNSMINVTNDQYYQVLWRLIHNTTSALNFLKQHRIVHRDVKPPNMLVNKEATFKICDFGISRIMRNSLSVVYDSRIIGTDCYLPPELTVPNPQPYGVRADMWALGLSLFEIIEGNNPFAQVLILKLGETIRNWRPKFSEKRPIPSDLENLIGKLLQREVNERPKSYQDILDLPPIQAVTIVPSQAEKDFVCCVIESIREKQN